jgi:hypothetical protein
MRLDLVHPAAEKISLVLEGIGDDKVWMNSSSLNHPLTILPDQALEIVAIAKITIPTRIVRQPTGSTMMPWAWPRWAAGLNETVTL